MSQENDNKDSIFLDGEGDSQVLIEQETSPGTQQVEQSDTDDIINTMDISAVPKDKPLETSIENEPVESKPVESKPIENEPVETVNIKVKTLSKHEYIYSYDVNKTVGEFKEYISSMMPEHPAPGLMKLILSGKVLKDEEKIEGLNIDDSKFMVMMTVKPKPKPSPATTVAPPPTTVVSTSAPTPAPIPTPASLVAPPVEPLVTTTPTTDVASTSSSTANNLETHPMAQMIPMFIAMLAKLAESPDSYSQIFQNPEVLKQIANDPNMRNTLLNIPAVREELLRLTPEMAQLMQAQPEQFSAFISHPDFMSVGVNMLNRAQSEMGGLPMGNYNDGMTGGNDDVMDQQMAESVGLTPENMNDINDIMSMGFSTPKSEVIQFYIACDKNKEMTISMILGG